MARHPDCARCAHSLPRHGPTVAGACTACDCACFAWPGSLEANMIALNRAVSDLGREMAKPFVALARKLRP